jgi:hypothetical protein
VKSGSRATFSARAAGYPANFAPRTNSASTLLQTGPALRRRCGLRSALARSTRWRLCASRIASSRYCLLQEWISYWLFTAFSFLVPTLLFPLRSAVPNDGAEGAAADRPRDGLSGDERTVFGPNRSVDTEITIFYKRVTRSDQGAPGPIGDRPPLGDRPRGGHDQTARRSTINDSDARYLAREPWSPRMCGLPLPACRRSG